MISITVKDQYDRFAALLTDLEKRQLPFAAANALNDASKQAVADLKTAMPKLFDRPVPFTLNAVYAPLRARKDNLVAAVAIKDFAGKGTPASKYLAPEIEGGGRNLKRFERRLSFSAAVPQAMQTIPAAGALLDQYGNVQRQQIGAILGNLRTYNEPGANQNVSDRKLNTLQKKGLVAKVRLFGRARYFAANSKQDGHQLGIWQILGPGRVGPVLLFARRPPTYSPRFPFFTLVESSVRRTFLPFLAKRFEEAWRTRK